MWNYTITRTYYRLMFAFKIKQEVWRCGRSCDNARGDRCGGATTVCSYGSSSSVLSYDGSHTWRHYSQIQILHQWKASLGQKICSQDLQVATDHISSNFSAKWSIWMIHPFLELMITFIIPYLFLNKARKLGYEFENLSFITWRYILVDPQKVSRFDILSS